MKRRLAAILAADVVGYSRLMGADEAGTLSALKAHRAEFIDPAIARHNGRIVKLMGDGALVEFASVVDALACAIAIQRGIMERSANVAADRRLQFRIGINMGDVIVEGDDIYGDGVNVAVRLEGLAEPGGVCISGVVFDSTEGKMAVRFQDLGLQNFKNIAKPVRAYQVDFDERQAPKAGPEREVCASTALRRPVIAVLPLSNMSGDPEQDYFADGLTEDLITALTHWRSFPVVARNSTFTYKGKATSATQVARELGAKYVVEGSVRKAGPRVRVTAQLIDGVTGLNVWAERYDRDMEDIFGLQDELTHRIAAILAPEVSRAELKRSESKRPNDLNAWDYYLRGEAALAKQTSEINQQARAHFERAIALDKTYSDAFTGLAVTWTREVRMEASADRAAALEQAISAAKQAIELDPDSSRAHYALSTAYILGNEHDLALTEAHLAVELNPNDPEVLHALGNKSDLAGDPEGIARMELAQHLNPRDPAAHVHLTFLARAYVNSRDYQAAIARARAAINRCAEYAPAHYILAIALAHTGNLNEAAAALERCELLAPGLVASRGDWRPYTDDARNEHLNEGLKKAMAANVDLA